MDFLNVFGLSFLIMVFGLGLILLEKIKSKFLAHIWRGFKSPPLAILLYEKHQAQQCCGGLAEELTIK